MRKKVVILFVLFIPLTSIKAQRETKDTLDVVSNPFISPKFSFKVFLSLVNSGRIDTKAACEWFHKQSKQGWNGLVRMVTATRLIGFFVKHSSSFDTIKGGNSTVYRTAASSLTNMFISFLGEDWVPSEVLHEFFSFFRGDRKKLAQLLKNVSFKTVADDKKYLVMDMLLSTPRVREARAMLLTELKKAISEQRWGNVWLIYRALASMGIGAPLPVLVQTARRCPLLSFFLARTVRTAGGDPKEWKLQVPDKENILNLFCPKRKHVDRIDIMFSSAVSEKTIDKIASLVVQYLKFAGEVLGLNLPKKVKLCVFGTLDEMYAFIWPNSVAYHPYPDSFFIAKEGVIYVAPLSNKRRWQTHPDYMGQLLKTTLYQTTWLLLDSAGCPSFPLKTALSSAIPLLFAKQAGLSLPTSDNLLKDACMLAPPDKKNLLNIIRKVQIAELRHDPLKFSVVAAQFILFLTKSAPESFQRMVKNFIQKKEPPSTKLIERNWVAFLEWLKD